MYNECQRQFSLRKLIRGCRRTERESKLIPGKCCRGTTRHECNGKTVSGTVLHKQTARPPDQASWDLCLYERCRGGDFLRRSWTRKMSTGPGESNSQPTVYPQPYKYKHIDRFKFIQYVIFFFYKL